MLLTLGRRIRLYGKSANLKTSVSRKQSTPNFPKNEHFLPPDTHTCAYQGVRNLRFLENLACFVFLKHPFWDLSFCLITHELWQYKIMKHLLDNSNQPLPSNFHLKYSFHLPSSGFSGNFVGQLSNFLASSPSFCGRISFIFNPNSFA